MNNRGVPHWSRVGPRVGGFSAFWPTSTQTPVTQRLWGHYGSKYPPPHFILLFIWSCQLCFNSSFSLHPIHRDGVKRCRLASIEARTSILFPIFTNYLLRLCRYYPFSPLSKPPHNRWADISANGIFHPTTPDTSLLAIAIKTLHRRERRL